MLDPEDRRAIDGLFQRLDAVEREAREPRDPEADALIARRIAGQPAAPYYMAQTVIVQQRALEAAEQRIEELERQVREGRSLVPRGRPAEAARGRYADEGQGPWARGSGAGSGGGFLAGAMQTALGVTGGILLGNALGGLLFGGDATHAAESPAGSDTDQADATAPGDESGGDSVDVADAGFEDADLGDMGDFGDF